MSDNITVALAFMLDAEKGFVNNPNDPGGATNYGITAETLARWRKAPVTADDVKALTPREAIEIFRAWYWLPLGCDRIVSPLVASILLDAAVLFGVGVAARFAQTAANHSGAALLTVDGHVGTKTVSALNSVNAQAFAVNFHALLKSRIGEIVARRPSSLEFRAGWENRIDRYLALKPNPRGKQNGA